MDVASGQKDTLVSYIDDARVGCKFEVSLSCDDFCVDL